MSFLLPHFLWGLLALIPLAAVYLIKVHPVRKKTSAWFLWDGIFKEHRAASLFQKLRNWLSLLLLMLAFIFLVLALAKPIFTHQIATEQVMIILDNSLSMNAKGRLDEARRTARGIIRSLPAGGRAAIFSLSGELVSATGFTASRRELMRGLDTIKGTDIAFNPDALKHISFTDSQRIILLSDGCFEGADQWTQSIEWIKIGKPTFNVGIVSFDARRIPGENQPLGLFFRVYASSPEPVEVEALLTYGTDQEVRRVFPLKLQPGLNEPQLVNLPFGEAGRWTLRLNVTDTLARDNVAYAVVPEIDRIRVAIRAPETHLFWQLCVNAFDDGINGLEITDQSPELELYRGAVSAQTADRLAIFAPTGTSPFWKSITENPFEASARVILPSHPLMRYAKIDGLVVHGVRNITPPEQAVILAETDEGIPLIYKTTQENKTAYIFNFDPAKNYFFLHPLFPVLVWSAASELMELEQEPAASIRAGSIVHLPSEQKHGTVIFPDGKIQPHSTRRFSPLEYNGFYQFKSLEKQLDIACSGASISEIELDNSSIEPTLSSKTNPIPLSEGFIITALLLLFLECVLYHRRKVG